MSKKPETVRYQMTKQVHDSEIAAWYDVGWSYIEPAEVPGYSVIKWESPKRPVQPYFGGASLEGRVGA